MRNGDAASTALCMQLYVMTFWHLPWQCTRPCNTWLQLLCPGKVQNASFGCSCCAQLPPSSCPGHLHRRKTQHTTPALSQSPQAIPRSPPRQLERARKTNYVVVAVLVSHGRWFPGPLVLFVRKQERIRLHTCSQQRLLASWIYLVEYSWWLKQ